MNTFDLRQRVPFKFTDELSGEDTTILDDQEQEELIQSLKDQNAASVRWQLSALKTALACSCILQFVFFISPARDNPLLAIFPSVNPLANTPIPLARLLALLSIAIHINLAMLVFPGGRPQTRGFGFKPLSYPMVYALSSIAPTLCVLLGRPWQTVAWWCLTGALVLFVQTVQSSVNMCTESISELETMKYVAPGA